MRDLKLKGWFLRRDLVRKCSGGARSSRDVATEIDTLVEGEALAQHVVEWKSASSRLGREFLTRIPGG